MEALWDCAEPSMQPLLGLYHKREEFNTHTDANQNILTTYVHITTFVWCPGLGIQQ